MATTTTLREKYNLVVSDDVMVALDDAQDALLDLEGTFQRELKRASVRVDEALNALVAHLPTERRYELQAEVARRKREDG